MADRRQIIDRIEKLYALASGGTSPGEAAAATAMAEKLMKKHGIKDSEVNKHRYANGEKVKQERRQQSYERSAHRSYDQRASWESYSQWQKERNERRRKEYEDFTHHYYQRTFEPRFVKADKVQETDKAYLLNVYLDEKKYPWSPLPVVIVSVWIPKSQVTAQVGRGWLLNGDLLHKNLKDNIPWLLKNHPVFKSQHHIEFHFKEII
jgi:hypothetical protein